jgi:hypothetical protein
MMIHARAIEAEGVAAVGLGSIERNVGIVKHAN